MLKTEITLFVVEDDAVAVAWRHSEIHVLYVYLKSNCSKTGLYIFNVSKTFLTFGLKK